MGASSNTISGYLQLKGSEVRMSWLAMSTSTEGGLDIRLHFSNGTLYGIWGSSGIWGAYDNDMRLRQPGECYLNVTTYLTDYVIQLWDYY